jgi:preprotein translocase subunit YajC
MRVNLFRGTVANIVSGALTIGVIAFSANLHAQDSLSANGAGSGQDSGQRRGGGPRGMGGMDGLAGARGILGTVSEVAADHYTIKTDAGDTYTVHFSVNTRILKQPAGGRRQGGNAQNGEGERQQPQPVKPTDIKVGDAITAGGEVDSAAKSVGAMFIMQLDPERAKEMRAMQANYGKTWLAGRITKIEDTNITIDGIVDHTPHVISVDENTSFRKRRDSITLADIKPGDQLRAEGAMKGGVFLATTVNAMEPRTPNERGGPGSGDGGSRATTQPANPQ